MKRRKITHELKHTDTDKHTPNYSTHSTITSHHHSTTIKITHYFKHTDTDKHTPNYSNHLSIISPHHYYTTPPFQTTVPTFGRHSSQSRWTITRAPGCFGPAFAFSTHTGHIFSHSATLRSFIHCRVRVGQRKPI